MQKCTPAVHARAQIHRGTRAPRALEFGTPPQIFWRDDKKIGVRKTHIGRRAKMHANKEIVFRADSLWPLGVRFPHTRFLSHFNFFSRAVKKMMCKNARQQVCKYARHGQAIASGRLVNARQLACKNTRRGQAIVPGMLRPPSSHWVPFAPFEPHPHHHLLLYANVPRISAIHMC